MESWRDKVLFVLSVILLGGDPSAFTPLWLILVYKALGTLGFWLLITVPDVKPTVEEA